MEQQKLPRSIKIDQFLDQRTNQIRYFTSILNKKTTQLNTYVNLPKKMRRRAMSHNRFRIPFRIRKHIIPKLIQKQQSQKRTVCRKHIRKNRLLFNQYKKRHTDCKWLELHLYHAKRMKMYNHFGYKVPLKNYDKGNRAILRFSNYSSCLYDMSFFQIGLLYSNQLDQIVTKHLQINNEQGRGLKKAIFKVDKTKYQVQTIIDKQKQCLILLFHPSLKDFVLEQFKDICIYSQKKSIFQLIGPQSLGKVYQLIHNLGTPQQDIQLFKNLEDPFLYPNYFNLCVQINNCCFSQKLINPTGKPLSQYIRLEFNNKQQTDAINQSINKLMDYTNESFRWWEDIPQVNESLLKFYQVKRSRYTHKHKAKKKQKKISEPTPKEQTQQQEKKQAKKTLYQIQLKHQLQQIKNINSIKIQFIINTSNKIPKLKIISDNVVSNFIWKKLNYLNCKSIGRKQYRAIHNSKFQFVFPQDLIFTEPGKITQQLRYEQLMKKFKNTPPSKSINYESINSPFPFYRNCLKLQNNLNAESFVKVIVKSVGKGIPSDGCYLCSMTNEDIQQFKKMLIQNKINSIHQEPFLNVADEEQKLMNLKEEQIEKRLLKLKTSRRIVGFGVGGMFNFDICKGSCLGYVMSKYLKSTSRHYFVGQVYKYKE